MSAIATSALIGGESPQSPVQMLHSRAASLSFEVRRALGPLVSWMDDPELRDLLIHVREERGELWVDRGGEATRVPEWQFTSEQVRHLAISLIAAGGRQLDDLHPSVDVHLGSGIRVHAVLPPTSVQGTAVSIRVPRLMQPSFDDLVAAGLCDLATAQRIRAAVLNRKNLLIAGSTGSGKTTLLAALLGIVPHTERIITIEDLAELRPKHPHHVSLEARPANAEGAGQLTVDRLLRESLRMRPDRIVLGECRGAEIATLLTALNTGHEGGAGTLHANRIEDVPARLEALGMMAGYAPQTLARQAVSALHLIVHLERLSESGSRISAIGRLVLQGDRLVVIT